MNKKVLVIGATGAMAVYLIPRLLEDGYEVCGITLDDVKSETEGLTYIKANAKDWEFIKKQVRSGYDVIVDFMIYTTLEDFKPYAALFLENSKHYIYFSTYRVYADDSPLQEGSKRILDVPMPADFVKEYEYSIYKAEQEDYLNASAHTHYTILRPAITYSKRRFQLTVLEANVLVYRMLSGRTVLLPRGAMDKQATMTWAGDVAKMISALILNPKAYSETYTVSTSEHMTWREIARIYEEIGGLTYKVVPDDVFLNILAPGDIYTFQQLKYDRCYDRVVDNRKILKASGLRQEELMPLKEGLKHELSRISLSDIPCEKTVNARMDAYLAENNL
ncbi:MAG: NAD-dependent epimerase/dehydratase family protein [Ruminococcaceae bacterium]|nr:NAD-dependent epimerase/dehydratase family protein [Oscillospiraceae bacterium]